MKQFNTWLACAVLALGAATSAHATDTSGTTYVLMDPGAPGVFATKWSFSDQSTGAPDDPFKDAHNVGAKFDDFFIFNVPDAETISFKVAAVQKGSAPGVDFIGGGYGGYGLYRYADGMTLDGAAATSSAAMTGGAWSLTSGTYVLEIAGVYGVKGGLYAGAIEGMPSAVPEASGAMMLLVGLAGLAGVARLRQRQA